MKYIKENKALFLMFCFLLVMTLLFVLFRDGVVNPFYFSNEYYLYYNIYSQLSQGNLPYIHFFVEYPPLAAFAIGYPEAFIPGLDRHIFQSIYFAKVSFFLLIYFYIFNKQNLSRKTELLLLTFFLALISSTLVYARYDIFPSIAFGIGVLFLYKYILDKSNTHFIVGTLLVGIAFSLKLFPAFFMLFFAVILFKQYGYKRSLYYILILTFVGLTSLVFVVLGLDNFKEFLSYQGNRDLQIESIYANLVYLLNLFGLIPLEHAVQNGAEELIDPLSKTLANSSVFILFGGYLVFTAFTFLKLKKEQNFGNIMILGSLITVLIFIIFNNVLSPQYLLWLVFLIPLLGLFKGMTKIEFNKLLIAFSLVILCTFVIYPLSYKYLVSGEWYMVFVLTIRNTLLVYILIVLSFLYSREFKVVEKK
jgi:hypothetical protein